MTRRSSNKTQSFIIRIRVLTLFVCLAALVLVGRLYVVQIVYSDDYEKRAESQYVSRNYHNLNRGSIFFQDRSGNLISAATLKQDYIIYINPQRIGAPEDLYLKLSAIVDIDEEIFLRKAERQDRIYEEVTKRVSKEDAEKIRRLGLSGVGLRKETYRYYPGGHMASQTVGFMGFIDDDFSGRYGIERSYDKILGRQGREINVNFFAEVFSNISRPENISVQDDEGDVVLTIEPIVQTFFERIVESVSEKWDSSMTAGLIMEPKTGAIRAMSASPSFDLNNFQIESDASIFLNPLVQSSYEVGSIIKPLTLAIGLDSGVITPSSTYNDRGYVTLNNWTIRNHDRQARGITDMQTVLNQSLNTGAVEIVTRMGNRPFVDHLLSFGIGERTGIELPGEVMSNVRNLNNPRDVEYATASFGQGISLTPIATARALSALGNGGYLPNLHVVDRVEYLSGKTEKTETSLGKQVISKKTSEDISRMLVAAVDTALLGGSLKIDGYSVAAKTGTAQIAKPGGGYHEDKSLHSFFGYFPAYDPEFIIFLYTVEPKNVRFASETLASPLMDTVRFLINYYHIPPDRSF